MAPGLHGDLQIAEDCEFHRREWRAKRVAWALFSLLLLAAVAGLLGPGPLSDQRSGGVAHGFTTEHERFGRVTAESTLRILLAASAKGENVRLRLRRSILESAKIKEVLPTPERVSLSGDYLLYELNVDRAREQTIRLVYEPMNAGSLAIELALDERPALNLVSFIYP